MIPILDHGYIKLVEGWGSDADIIRAARMSTNKGFQGWEDKHYFESTDSCCLRCGVEWELMSTPCSEKTGDEKLLSYLWEHEHRTPFEMAGMTFEVQAPIFVFREWHRHRTQSYNEMSARYTPLPDINYVPSIERLLMNAKGPNRQAGTIAEAIALTIEEANNFREALTQVYSLQEELYQMALKNGVPKELARIHLPVGRYSRMRASANLRNWLAFLTLRMDKAAQWEIRQYAAGIAAFIATRFPRTHALWLRGHA